MCSRLSVDGVSESTPEEIQGTMRALQQQNARLRGLASQLHALQGECREKETELGTLRQLVSAHAAEIDLRDAREEQLRRDATEAAHNNDEAMVRARGAIKLLTGQAPAEIPEERLLLTSYELFRQWGKMHEHFKSMQ